MLHKHEIYFVHDRLGMDTSGLGEYPEATSTVTIAVESADIVEAWTEFLTRMPPDLRAGLETAMELAKK